MSVQLVYSEFTAYLKGKNRLACVESALRQLSEKRIDLVTLYEQVLAPSLRENFCAEGDREVCVWEEHLRTSIVRTVIENCYPYLIRERDQEYKPRLRGKAVVFCPQEEYHELGARMVTDFLTLCGFEAFFIGANTPAPDIAEAVVFFDPELVAISVSNYFNLVVARRTIQKIRMFPNVKEKKFQIIAGGNAFSRNPDVYQEIGADCGLDSFEEIRGFVEGLA